ncbi:MAG: S9 family peptidase [Burkholderiales bacterium]|nr:S9 family peptidase [Burkholderiales bacterium]
MSDSPATVPPVAVREPVQTTIHGEHRIDDYRWLQDKDSPRVRAHLEAENAHTKAVMAHTEGLQETLYREMLARIQETDMDVPYRDGPFEYYARTEQGKNYPILCRRPVPGGAEQVTLDLDAMAQGHEYFALGAYDASPDAGLLAFSTDVTGFREYTLQVKDLRSGEILPLRVERARSVAWALDSATLFYVVEDEAKRAYRLYRHRLGSTVHALMYEEADERFSIGVDGSRSRGWLFLTSHSATTSEVRCLSADRPEGAFALIAPRRHEHEYYVDHRGDEFYIVTNDRGRNFRAVTAPVSAPGEHNWRELVPHRDGVMLDGIDLFARHYVLHERRDGFPRLRVVRIDSGEGHDIDTPEQVCAVHAGANAEFDTDRFRFVYESLVTPDSVFDYDMDARSRVLLKQRPVLGGYDPSRYASELLHAAAADGTPVPVSMVYRRDMRRSQGQPMLLTGYGAYGYPHDVHFSSARLSLLERGVIVAVAHVRGGGEMGKRWHDEGRMLAKRNTFTDFIAAAETVIGQRYTTADRLVIEGGSAGGLLMGAVTNMRPDLFKAVVADVPFVDVINTMLDPSLPLTTGEYEEWGNPNDAQHYAVMRAYSPYDNLEAKAYPAMLVQTSLNDSQVMYWEPAKYVARLRALKTDTNPLLLRTNMEAGHGGASGRYDFLREIAFGYAFMLWQLGLG